MKYFLGVLPVPTMLWTGVHLAFFIYAMTFVVPAAYSIRIFAIQTYGKVIHEFDPWFNFRSAQYLQKKGWHAFFHWFDYQSWYPLGRPVGTTIYPGLQLTAVGIHKAIKYLNTYDAAMFPVLTLNHICCYIPAWFGAVTSVITALLSWECTGSVGAGAVAGMLMAYVPAHSMRSVGGGFDNESIGVPAIVLTFYLWVRSLRTSSSWWIGIFTGLSYGYMVAAWGGFVVVLNAITAHAALLALFEWCRGNFSRRLHRAYSLFYIIGTYIATCVPPVNTQPFRSLEQLASLVLFILLQGCFVAEQMRLKEGVERRSSRGRRLHIMAPFVTLGGMLALAVVLFPTGYFGPLSSRVRSLFMQHTKTGNPLVDSVAEHQSADESAYQTFLHHVLFYSRLGSVIVFAFAAYFKRMRAASFIFLYFMGSLHFSHKMSRLILLLAPGAVVMSSCWLGGLAEFAVRQLFFDPATKTEEAQEMAASAKTEKSPTTVSPKETIGKPNRKTGKVVSKEKSSDSEAGFAVIKERVLQTQVYAKQQWASTRWARIAALAAIGTYYTPVLRDQWDEFVTYSQQKARQFSEPQLMWQHNGRIIDDYRTGYNFLREKTPKDARVMAWWDYGYQITGIAQRTALADGNTWNHEHIATIGFMLSSELHKSHRLIKHVADYVLLWCGKHQQKDMDISRHFARIGNSVYNGHCKDGPSCGSWATNDKKWTSVSPMVEKSLVWNLCKNMHNAASYNQYFELAYETQHSFMTIWKVKNVSESSKEWLADPANRDCDAPGSWYCTGNYPPVKPWQALLERRKSFAQLEDFNKKQ